MSGSGQDDFRAPTYLTPIAGDEPIATTDEGVSSRPTMHFVQLIQRLLSYVGQPTGGNPAGQTLSSQVGAVNIFTSIIISAVSAANAGLVGRVLQLESAGQQRSQPLPRPPGLSQPQVLARIWFFR